MIPDWALAAFVVALLAYPLQVFAVQPLVEIFRHYTENFYRWVTPSAGTCISFEWKDLPEALHARNVGYPLCSKAICASDHQAVNIYSSSSWAAGLELLFPYAWESAKARVVPKPQQLSTAKRYIRADPKAFLSYLYFLLEMTRRPKAFPDSLEEMTRDARFGFDKIISLERHGRHIVARFSDDWLS